MKQFAAFLLVVCAAIAPVCAEDITIGKSYTFHSEILDEDQSYGVALPVGYTPDQSYPVIYVLDGWELQFQAVTAVARAQNMMGSLMPGAIVVSLPSNDRYRDYFASSDDTDDEGHHQPWMAAAGGGERYLQVLRQEVFPLIEKAYNVKPYRVLVGHSAGAALGLHDLMSGANSFNAYLMIDPPVTMQSGYLLKLSQTMEEVGAPKLALYLSYVPHDDGKHIAALREMLANIEARAPSGFRATSQLFEKETHQSVQLESYVYGLRAIFDGYTPPPIEDAAKDPMLLAKHYAGYSGKLGVEFLPDQAFTNTVAYNALNYYQWPEKARQLFQMNVENFPKSSWVWSGMGDYYAGIGETEQAAKAFEKALALEADNSYAAQRLKDVQAKLQ
ncbi:alpha/beta hydrolase-fold protein [Kordiimonas lipolytica]|uniref:Alpha/beta hydrolase-fold protein n=1 Tax=Kordiimonas lipolytica TaxID=1662421 RepID=A0ABV8UCT1_9PROT|nr:alpha/beta hydrolase-fold protein [Kordiimonas lipolytica]